MQNLTSTEILKSMLISGLNHGFTLLAAWAISRGLFAADVASADNILILAGGAAAALISAGMLLYRKYAARRVTIAASVLPTGTPIEDIKAKAATLPLTGKE